MEKKISKIYIDRENIVYAVSENGKTYFLKKITMEWKEITFEKK